MHLILVAIGFPANLIVLFVSVYNFHKSKSETILIINLALADLMQLRKGCFLRKSGVRAIQLLSFNPVELARTSLKAGKVSNNHKKF